MPIRGWIATGQPEPYQDPYWLPGSGIEVAPPETATAPAQPRAKAVRVPHPTAVDFESYGILSRPEYPPEPVGVAIKPWGKKGRYWAWGHPTGGNNCTKAEAAAALKEAYACPDGILMHHAKFDLDVAEVHFKLAPPPWHKVHDTTFNLFLDDPHIRHVGLKQAAHKLLKMPPEERDVVAEWLVAHQPVEGVRITRTNFGKYIAFCPGDIVGPYALGDVVRTEALFKHLYTSMVVRGMAPAYDRERKLVPVLLDMERGGLRVDVGRLSMEVDRYSVVVRRLEAWVQKRLGIGSDVNLNSAAQLVEALDNAGVADVSAMGLTPGGRVATDKKAMAAGVTDKQLAAVLQYLSQLSTCLNTFMKPWLETARRSGGLIFTNWNQIRGDKSGARTGRFSSSDTNLQNIPKEFEVLFYSLALITEQRKAIKGTTGMKREDGEKELARLLAMPKAPFALPPLPLCRGFIIPYKTGHILVARDYSQQEPRILAHFEDGELMEQYKANPWIDYHDNAKEHLERIFHRVFKRRPVKNINLGIIYGQGIAALAEKNGESYKDTADLRNAIYGLYPGLKDMNLDMRGRAKAGLPIRTWGGREYYCQPPDVVKGKVKTFDYKMVNILVQGSAADCTKEGMIRFITQRGVLSIEAGLRYLKKRGWYLLLQVHDELLLSVPEKDMVEAQEALRVAMESVEFDVKILSEGSASNDNWSVMKEYDKKGKMVWKRA